MMKILWKLASGEYEDSPWARILKAKYLARKPLWMATVPSSCTKLWRAIMGMREILKKHITWQLANGDKCQVFGQPWHEFWLEFKPTNRYDRALVVSDLIDTESQTWNSQKLIHALGFYGALFIACNTPVPPCNSNHTDRLIFKASQNGKFSYKAAVRLLQGELAPLDGQASGVIKLIWHTPGLLPRIRIFLWKMFHNSIPTQGLYARRLGKPQPSCPLCNNDDDDASHALFKCPAARAFWLASNIGLHSLALPSNLSQVLSIIGNSLIRNDFITFACHVWAFWKQRCATVFHGNKMNVMGALSMADSYASLIRETSMLHIPRALRNVWEQSIQEGTVDALVCWVDGSFSKPGDGGWAYILMKGDVLIQYAAQHGQIPNAFSGELKALQLAVRDTLLYGARQCLFLTDCDLLMKIMCGEEQVDVVPWQSFFEAKEAVNQFRLADNFKCTLCNRNDNKIAHQLANYARIHRVDFRDFTFPLTA
ncbi:Cyclopropane-fatty-acyl-phospholipid synthase [Rhynchospora pubera]|uniref:Cyclopropane-fatty-acyl-phospholipid synthase n=1 Tax=Rhynchospora pubera TaxID=906938 RepID=A0AAV8H747_9POAL|nr:Cyclopropane-fatty-acyl-phospholipid synthase [Rhynchospora pubera]